MKILKFKTNIENDNSLREVSAVLDSEQSISKWKVDTGRDDNLLSVSGEEIDPQLIEDLVKRAGYKAELARALGIGGEDV